MICLNERGDEATGVCIWRQCKRVEGDLQERRYWRGLSAQGGGEPSITGGSCPAMAMRGLVSVSLLCYTVGEEYC